MKSEKMLSSQLHQTLRSLCFNTEWKYAVFWKPKHSSPMMLSLEDVYYGQNYLENEVDIFHGTSNFCDPLGLAVAKMWYRDYSMGDGIVGRVAVTGKHMWYFDDKQGADIFTSPPSSDGWQTQFHAGIRTVAVVGVMPHGVVQLGSLNKVPEDLKLVNHIKNVFYLSQGFSSGYIPNPIQSNMGSSLIMPDVATESSCSEVYQSCQFNQNKFKNTERLNASLSTLPPYLGRSFNSSYSVPKSDLYQECAVDKQIGSELLQPGYESFKLQSQKQMDENMYNESKYKGKTIGWNETGLPSKENSSLHPQSVFSKGGDLYNLVEASEENMLNSPTGILNPAVFDQCNDLDFFQNGMLQIPDSSYMQQIKELEKKLEEETDLSCIDSLNTSLQFSACSELHEVLGSFFQPNIPSDCNAEMTLDMPKGISRASDFESDNLLEAVVANVCLNANEKNKSEKSFCESVVQSLLTTGKNQEASSYLKHSSGSVDYSMEQPSLTEGDSKQCLNGTKPPTGFSTNCPSTCSEQLERSNEGIKTKKRARAGESCRPRPRDRQLIQDRIKELRELVPNGSKCSIDSLLERTIKHMLFMQSMSKYADKMKECDEFKVCNKEQSMLGSTHEQGSSWAVEVGSPFKVCPIVVENLNMNGQMLVEMLCEECSQFLEIAEAIRSLGLTILKGGTETHGQKARLCFVVEGQSNRTIHRMDILWSLVQILQPKNAVQ